MVSLEFSELVLELHLLLLPELVELLLHVRSSRLQLQFSLHLLDLLLKLVLLLPFDFFDFASQLVIEVSLLPLQLPLHVSLHLLDLVVVLRLDLPLLGLKSINVYLLAFKQLILFIFELFNFEVKPLLLTFLDLLPEPLVVIVKLLFFGCKLGLQFSFELSKFVLGVVLDPPDLPLFFQPQLVLETLDLQIDVVIDFLPDFTLLFTLVLVPFLLFLFDLFFVLPDQFFFFELTVAVKLLDAHLEFLLVK